MTSIKKEEKENLLWRKAYPKLRIEKSLFKPKKSLLNLYMHNTLFQNNQNHIFQKSNQSQWSVPEGPR